MHTGHGCPCQDAFLSGGVFKRLTLDVHLNDPQMSTRYLAVSFLSVLIYFGVPTPTPDFLAEDSVWTRSRKDILTKDNLD